MSLENTELRNIVKQQEDELIKYKGISEQLKAKDTKISELMQTIEKLNMKYPESPPDDNSTDKDRVIESLKNALMKKSMKFDAQEDSIADMLRKIESQNESIQGLRRLLAHQGVTDPPSSPTPSSPGLGLLLDADGSVNKTDRTVPKSPRASHVNRHETRAKRQSDELARLRAELAVVKAELYVANTIAGIASPEKTSFAMDFPSTPTTTPSFSSKHHAIAPSANVCETGIHDAPLSTPTHPSTPTNPIYHAMSTPNDDGIIDLSLVSPTTAADDLEAYLKMAEETASLMETPLPRFMHDSEDEDSLYLSPMHSPTKASPDKSPTDNPVFPGKQKGDV